MRKIRPFHLLVLILILGLGAILFYLAKGNPFTQFIIGVVTAFAYVVWGIVDHYIHRDLREKVVIEYLLIGCIAVVVLAIVLHS